jgi:hypothetical protein
MKCRSEKGKGSTFYFTVKFGIPTSQTKPLPQTPQNDSNNDPFFRSNGYGNNTTAQAIVETLETQNPSPLPFVNKNLPSSTDNIPLSQQQQQQQQTDSSTSPADILQDVLMTKAASMQLKPPPIRNHPTTAAAVAVAAATSLLARQVVSEHMTKPNEPRIPTIGTGPGLTNSPNGGVVILPPRTPTRMSPLRALIVAQWPHSRESMEKHVRSILGNLQTSPDNHFQVDTLTNQLEATECLTDPYTPAYDYIMINLPSEQQILSLTRAICGSLQQQQASVLVVTTPMQRSLITEGAKGREDQVIPRSCGFVFKPLKRSKLRWYFGVRHTESKQHELQSSTAVSTPDTPYKRAATQKEVFRKMEADVGGKGFRVLLVEGKINIVLGSLLTLFF